MNSTSDIVSPQLAKKWKTLSLQQVFYWFSKIPLANLEDDQRQKGCHNWSRSWAPQSKVWQESSCSAVREIFTYRTREGLVTKSVLLVWAELRTAEFLAPRAKSAKAQTSRKLLWFVYLNEWMNKWATRTQKVEERAIGDSSGALHVVALCDSHSRRRPVPPNQCRKRNPSLVTLLKLLWKNLTI